MSYHFKNTQLRVVQKFAKQKMNLIPLSNTRIIILEHILPTTEQFIYTLAERGTEFYKILAKPYSIDEKVYNRLKEKFPLETKSYQELESSDFLKQLIINAIELCKKDAKNFIIIDVGGYFARPLSELDDSLSSHITGVIEDTTFGHNRYLNYSTKIKASIFSVARSNLKEIEARFVGKDAVYAMDSILRKIGISIAGRNALVIGYGMIGKNVARTLRSNDLNVNVYDKEDHKNLTAFTDGFHIHKKRELLKVADIIFLATGNPDGALSYEEIEECFPLLKITDNLKISLKILMTRNKNVFL